MHVRGAEGERVVDESGIDHHSPLRPVEQIRQVKKVTVTASHAVSSAILVQHKNLARREPALNFQIKYLFLKSIHDVVAILNYQRAERIV